VGPDEAGPAGHQHLLADHHSAISALVSVWEPATFAGPQPSRVKRVFEDDVVAAPDKLRMRRYPVSSARTRPSITIKNHNVEYIKHM
jgi:hypothetical protein